MIVVPALFLLTALSGFGEDGVNAQNPQGLAETSEGSTPIRSMPLEDDAVYQKPIQSSAPTPHSVKRFPTNTEFNGLGVASRNVEENSLNLLISQQTNSSLDSLPWFHSDTFDYLLLRLPKINHMSATGSHPGHKPNVNVTNSDSIPKDDDTASPRSREPTRRPVNCNPLFCFLGTCDCNNKMSILSLPEHLSDEKNTQPRHGHVSLNMDFQSKDPAYRGHFSYKLAVLPSPDPSKPNYVIYPELPYQSSPPINVVKKLKRIVPHNRHRQKPKVN